MNPILRRVLGESIEPAASRSEPKEIVERTRTVTYDVCPHCDKEIFEKHTYVDENQQEVHRDCGGAIKPSAARQAQSAKELEAFKKQFGI